MGVLLFLAAGNVTILVLWRMKLERVEKCPGMAA
jgi:hypothetical protein